MTIVLMGYMASGKSTIGRSLATKLGYSFMDLDQYIEDKEGVTIKQMFTDKGELYFRNKETQYLDEVLASNNKLVLALGGGTPCYGNNLKLIANNKNAITIYLKASINAIIQRVENEKAKRPLIAHLNSKEDLAEFIGKHLFERTQFYNKADYTISTDDLTIDEVVEQIVLKLY